MVVECHGKNKPNMHGIGDGTGKGVGYGTGAGSNFSVSSLCTRCLCDYSMFTFSKVLKNIVEQG